MAPADFQGVPEDDQPGAPAPQDNINFVKEAFHLQYNWIAMVSAGAFALVSGSFLPIILAGGLELMYLAIVPQNWRFQRLVRSWKFAEEQQKQQQKLSEMLAQLACRDAEPVRPCRASVRLDSHQLRAVFLHLADLFAANRHAAARPAEWLCPALVGAAQQQQYVKSTEQDGIKHEIASLQKTLSSDPPKVQEINKKRIEILTKRLEKFDKISENRKVVDAQCSAVEDVLMLVRDQSVTMRDPQQVSERLDSLVHDVEQTEQTVQQVEAIFSGMSPDLDGLMSLDDSSTSSSPNRVRMSN